MAVSCRWVLDGSQLSPALLFCQLSAAVPVCKMAADCISYQKTDFAVAWQTTISPGEERLIISWSTAGWLTAG